MRGVRDRKLDIRRALEEPRRLIVVVGYPKSGTTWTAKLIGNALRCPVDGLDFLDEPDSATQDALVVRRWHYLHSDIRHLVQPRNIVYVVRDVRDVVVSGAAYFFGGTDPVSIDHMIEWATRDNLIQLDWTDSGWGNHVKGYWASGCAIIRYEDLVRDTRTQLTSILAHMGLDSDDVDEAISHQSFAAAKRRALRVGNERQAKFLRAGRVGMFNEHLSASQLAVLETNLSSALRMAGY